MSYTDVFGNSTLPPAEYGYRGLVITTDTTLVWPYNTNSSATAVAKILDISCASGNIVTLPDATEVSTGEDFLIRNVGSYTITVKNASGVQIATVAVGAASYFYLTDNSTAAGTFGVIGFGVGTSTVDAASLVGYGIKAVGASLNQSHPVFPTSSGITVGSDHRAKLVVFTGGTGTFSLTSAATLGDDYFTLFRNDGTGTATIDPASSELVDGMTTMQIQPGESLMLICTGTQWYSVGYGRSTLYQFTQLTKDVSAGGTITLTAAEAANKLITFIGNPSGAVDVVVPGIVAVYYTLSSISTTQTITLKTAAGSGVGITQGARIIALCDGTNVVSAQSATANSSVSLTDGSVSVPSLFFATKSNTGLYKSGTQDVGVTVNGSSAGVFGSTGLQSSTIGANSSQRHTVPAVASDTVTLLAASQTLTNKTISGASNTLSNIANASLTNSSITINGNSVSLGGSTTVTATASNALTISTGLTGTSYNGSSPVTIAIDSTVATLAGSQTLTNKTVALGSNTVSGTLAQFNTACTDADFASLAGSETLTNKTVNLTNNTLTGTKAEFDTACSDDNFLYVGSTTYVAKDSATGAAYIPAGTSAQQPGSPAAGYFRFNTTIKQFEGYNGSAWGAVGGGATGASSNPVFYENDIVVNGNYTLGSGEQLACTISIASPAVITQANNYVAGQPVRFTTSDALPTGLSVDSIYYVSATGLSASSFQVSATSGGASVNTSGTQSGTHTCGRVKNAMSAGPITVANGISVTVPSGSVWTIV